MMKDRGSRGGKYCARALQYASCSCQLEMDNYFAAVRLQHNSSLWMWEIKRVPKPFGIKIFDGGFQQATQPGRPG
jgi:hypothetical protein